MLIEIPDHFVANIGGALVERAVQVIRGTGVVPAYLFQFAEMWDKGLRFGGSDVSFWQAVVESDRGLRPLLKGKDLIA